MGIFDRFKKNKPSKEDYHFIVMEDREPDPKPVFETVEGNTLDPVITEADPVIKEEKPVIKKEKPAVTKKRASKAPKDKTADKQIFMRKLYCSGGSATETRKNLSISITDAFVSHYQGSNYAAVTQSGDRPHTFRIQLKNKEENKHQPVMIRAKCATQRNTVIHFRSEAVALLGDAPYVKVIINKKEKTMTFIGVDKDGRELRNG